jgi:hypothetical protein
LTETSQAIQEKFGKILANLNDIYAYTRETEIQNKSKLKTSQETQKSIILVD